MRGRCRVRMKWVRLDLDIQHRSTGLEIVAKTGDFGQGADPFPVYRDLVRKLLGQFRNWVYSTNIELF